MEKKLNDMFDYQKFAGNKRLQAVIDSARRRPRELSLEEADLVSAAYAPYVSPDKDGKKDSRL